MITKHLPLMYTKQGKYPQADTLYKRVVAIRKQEYGASSPKLEPILKSYAGMLRKANRMSELDSIEAQRKALIPSK